MVARRISTREPQPQGVLGRASRACWRPLGAWHRWSPLSTPSSRHRRPQAHRISGASEGVARLRRGSIQMLPSPPATRAPMTGGCSGSPGQGSASAPYCGRALARQPTMSTALFTVAMPDRLGGVSRSDPAARLVRQLRRPRGGASRHPLFNAISRRAPTRSRARHGGASHAYVARCNPRLSRSPIGEFPVHCPRNPHAGDREGVDGSVDGP